MPTQSIPPLSAQPTEVTPRTEPQLRVQQQVDPTVSLPRNYQETTQLPRSSENSEETTVIPRVSPAMPETQVAPRQLPQYRVPVDPTPTPEPVQQYYDPSYATQQQPAYAPPVMQQQPVYQQPAYEPTYEPQYAPQNIEPPQPRPTYTTNKAAGWSLGLGIWSLVLFVTVILLPIAGILAFFGLITGLVGLILAAAGPRPGGVKSVFGLLISGAVLAAWVWLVTYISPMLSTFWLQWDQCSAQGDGYESCLLNAVLQMFGFEANLPTIPEFPEAPTTIPEVPSAN
ncbi:hypothetical protein FRX94_07910 [Corynebacterium canis]|uniref:DUF4190 domain-containing protein n=1 Tax=Corynebacterium canis TaxID=679663 RepID=A0A5C5UGJ7_9CORY|nr:phage holin family protein [Corynebacterium canis]TWT24590.1 hypothetical protein FRX94_07910 [Corynebacterium canis]WJY75477.1 hypothetical protein CCANI_08245 [Corynebacterium canis]